MKTPFICASKAYCTSRPSAAPVTGIRNLAKVAHAHGVPVSWILDEQTALEIRDELADWHGHFGDDVAAALVRLPVDAGAYTARREAIRRACPWSRVDVAGAGGGKSGRMVAALLQAGFRGLWGYCWEQVYVDGITDYGHPPGVFIASEKAYKMPSPSGQGLVAVEWLSRDLNKAFWTANPVHFAPESDAMILFGDWDSETTFTYGLHILDQYIRNAQAGHPLPFVFQEEAEQLMPGGAGRRYDGVWDKMLAWIAEYFQRMPVQKLDFTTLAELVAACHRNPRPAQLVRARDMACPPLRHPVERRPVWGAEWQFPEVAHYSDARRFATFVVGNPAPVRLIRYDRQEEVDVAHALLPEPEMPRLLELRLEDDRLRARIQGRLDTPYAVAVNVPPGFAAAQRLAVNEDLAVGPLEVKAGDHWYEIGHA